MRAPRTALAAVVLLLAGLGVAPASADTAVVRVAELGPDHPRATRPDPDGRATTSLELYRDDGRVCWSIRFEHMQVRRLVVHREPTGTEALELYDEAPDDGPSLSGCLHADPGLVRELADAPERFSVRSESYAGDDVAGALGVPRRAEPGPARSTDRACPPGQVPEDGFRDVPEGAVHEASVDCVVWWRVAAGRGPDRYDPAGTVTGGEMATFVANAIRNAYGQLPPASRDWFGDDNGTAHEANTNALREAGIVDGVAPGIYRPGAPVTRGAMATFLARAHAHRTGERLVVPADFFGDDDGTVHEASTNGTAGVGLTGGTGGGRYSPGAVVRRDAMASFVARLLDLWVEQRHTAPPGAAQR